jgi:hypothetical protein
MTAIPRSRFAEDDDRVEGLADDVSASEPLAGLRAADLSVDDLSVDDLSVDDLSVDDLSVDDLPVDDLSPTAESADDLSADLGADDFAALPADLPVGLFVDDEPADSTDALPDDLFSDDGSADLRGEDESADDLFDAVVDAVPADDLFVADVVDDLLGDDVSTDALPDDLFSDDAFADLLVDDVSAAALPVDLFVDVVSADDWSVGDVSADDLLVNAVSADALPVDDVSADDLLVDDVSADDLSVDDRPAELTAADVSAELSFVDLSALESSTDPLAAELSTAELSGVDVAVVESSAASCAAKLSVHGSASDADLSADALSAGLTAADVSASDFSNCDDGELVAAVGPDALAFGDLIAVERDRLRLRVTYRWYHARRQSGFDRDELRDHFTRGDYSGWRRVTPGVGAKFSQFWRTNSLSHSADFELAPTCWLSAHCLHPSRRLRCAFMSGFSPAPPATFARISRLRVVMMCSPGKWLGGWLGVRSVHVDVAVPALGVRGAGLLAVAADERALAARAGHLEAVALANAVGGREARCGTRLRIVRERVGLAAGSAGDVRE